MGHSELVKLLSLIGTALWMLIGIVNFIGINNLLKPKYKKFYPHPAIGCILDNREDFKLSDSDRKLINILLVILYIPITLEWFVAWCLWKFFNFMVDQFVENAPINISISHGDEENTNNNNTIEAELIEEVPSYENVPEDLNLNITDTVTETNLDTINVEETAGIEEVEITEPIIVTTDVTENTSAIIEDSRGEGTTLPTPKKKRNYKKKVTVVYVEEAEEQTSEQTSETPTEETND